MRLVLLLLFLTPIIVVASERSESVATENKADEIIFPTLVFRDATAPEVLKFLQQRSQQLDTAKKGITLVSPNYENAPDRQKIEGLLLSMDLKYIPFMEALKYVAALSGLKFRIYKDSIIFAPHSNRSAFDQLYDVSDWQRKAVARYLIWVSRILRCTPLSCRSTRESATLARMSSFPRRTGRWCWQLVSLIRRPAPGAPSRMRPIRWNSILHRGKRIPRNPFRRQAVQPRKSPNGLFLRPRR